MDEFDLPKLTFPSVVMILQTDKRRKRKDQKETEGDEVNGGKTTERRGIDGNRQKRIREEIGGKGEDEKMEGRRRRDVEKKTRQKRRKKLWKKREGEILRRNEMKETTEEKSIK